mmetsp:Transcript_17766/g.26954  ORF Transcript_17766/g.26954 Transcript_17766/m.26954 type:complete len:197 (+) Transcript_17766:23-613(+)
MASRVKLILIFVLLFCTLSINHFRLQYIPSSATFVEDEIGERHLSQFQTIDLAFERADMVGLYFAASWCPMSTPPTKLLESIFTPAFLSPPSGNKAKFAIVYVSSDKEIGAMESYMKPNWIGVPFQSEEQTAIKKHFLVCSKRELKELQINRKHEIPSLFIFDSDTRNLITTDGVADIKRYGTVDVLDYWNSKRES